MGQKRQDFDSYENEKTKVLTILQTIVDAGLSRDKTALNNIRLDNKTFSEVVRNLKTKILVMIDFANSSGPGMAEDIKAFIRNSGEEAKQKIKKYCEEREAGKLQEIKKLEDDYALLCGLMKRLERQVRAGDQSAFRHGVYFKIRQFNSRVESISGWRSPSTNLFTAVTSALGIKMGSYGEEYGEVPKNPDMQLLANAIEAYKNAFLIRSGLQDLRAAMPDYKHSITPVPPKNPGQSEHGPSPAP